MTTSPVARWRGTPGDGVTLLAGVTAQFGGVTLHLGPPKQRAMFVVLALSANAAVSTDALIGALWGDRPPRTASHSLQIYVSQLRKTFAGIDGAPAIVTVEPGYRLVVDRSTIDVLQFEDLISGGLAAVAEGRIDDGRADLLAALSVWNGAPLDEFAYDDFAQPHVARLWGLYLDAAEALAAIELDEGRPREALQLALVVEDRDPLRERAQELIMLAQYRAGRHVEAIRTFDRYRRLLGDELGLEPSSALRSLHARMLVHDPALSLGAPPSSGTSSRPRNPYKGLRSFNEDDAADFFGRDALVERIVAAVADGQRLVALVGASGSGKSSVVAAGVVPVVRSGAIGDDWVVAWMVPGAQPLREARTAIADAEARAQSTSAGQGGNRGQRSSSLGTTGDRRVLLVIDQFEELFTVADEQVRDRFLTLLAESIGDPASGLCVMLTLRADFYDQPLRAPSFAAVFADAVLNVLPMTARELEEAIVGPAALVGMAVEPALLAQLLVRTDDHHGSLPLLQYALSVQFDAADDGVLTLETHTQLGGLHAILARHADHQYNALSEHDQHLAQRVLLRMVRVGPAGTARRRAPIAELTDLSADTEALSVVLDSLDEHRLITFDRDALTGEATVELAHDTLLDGWPRLATWIEHHRDGLVRLESLRLALAGWQRADCHPDHLLTGNRLAVIDHSPLHEAVALNDAERAFLDRSRSHQHSMEAGEAARAQAEGRMVRRSQRRLAALAVVLVLLVGLGAWALVLVRDAPAEQVVLLRPELGDVASMVEHGFDRAVGEFGYTSNKVVLPGASDEVDDALSADPELVVAFAGGEDLQTIAETHPSTRFVVLDGLVSAPNVASMIFDANEASFLAGAAAALTSHTGIVAFIGGVDEDVIRAFEAGFTAGARHVDPNIRVLTDYLTQPPNYDGYLNPALGRRAALDLFQHGADVVFAAAGLSGLGAIDAAVEVSTDTGTQRWAIGVDSDQFVSVEKRPEIADPAAWQAHILTSVTKGLDEVAYDALADPTGTAFQPGVHHLGLDDGAVDISYTGGHIDAIRPQLDELRAAIIAGSIAVPTNPT